MKYSTLDELIPFLPEIIEIDFYEYFERLQIDFYQKNIRYERIIPEECFMYDSTSDSEINIFLKKNLKKMVNLKSFSYTSKFHDETTYEFLINKSPTLNELYLDHLNGLNLNFLNGITKLTLTYLDDSFIRNYKKIPPSIKTITFYDYEDLNLQEDFMVDTNLTYKIILD